MNGINHEKKGFLSAGKKEMSGIPGNIWAPMKISPPPGLIHLPTHVEPNFHAYPAKPSASWDMWSAGPSFSYPSFPAEPEFRQNELTPIEMDWQGMYNTLLQENAALRAKNEALRAENEELCRKLANKL